MFNFVFMYNNKQVYFEVPILKVNQKGENKKLEEDY